MKNKPWLKIIIFFFISVLLSNISIIAASNAPNVTLVTPGNGVNFTTNNNLTFVINATDDENLKNVTLYHNISGSFEENQTVLFGEFEKDDDTLLLCHFNGDYTCADGELGANFSTSFDFGRFQQGVLVNNSDNLTYSTSGNLDRDQGTIEFWVKPMADLNSLGSDVMFFIVGDPDDNEFRNQFYLFFSSGSDLIVFQITDYEGDSKFVRQDASGWKADEWHHITAIWDLDSNVTSSGDRMDLYLDGSRSGNQYTSTGDTIIQDFASPYIFIGSWLDSTSQADATIDELRISNIPRNASEITQSYQNGISNYTNETVSWTIENIPDGYYIWNALAFDNESQSNWSASNYSFTVDVNPPTVNSVAISPNATDDIDPSVTINVTTNVTDSKAVDTVILQWKETGDWNNATMDSSGNIYNASFDIDLTGGVYYYRIWSNDTFGHAGTSNTYNISADWDYSWTKSPSNGSFGTVSGSLNSVGYIGTLIINNTGDDSLSFDLSHNWPLDVSYNVTEPFSLAAKTAIHINVNATFANSDSENDMTITITASHGSETPSPTSAQVNVTLDSFSGGPYLDLSITSFSASVQQSAIFNITARLKNVGNETGTSTYRNWTLPSGWNNISGDLYTVIGDVNSGTIELGVLTVEVDPASAGPGIWTVSVSSNCTEGAFTNASALIAVSCSSSDGVCGYGCSSNTDSDCPSPPAPSGGGGSPPSVVSLPIYSPSEIEKDEVFPSLAPLEMIRGTSQTFPVSVTNPFENSTLDDVRLVISGYPAERLIIEPSTLSSIGFGETKEFLVTVVVPASEGTVYNLDLALTGNVSYHDYPTQSSQSGRVLKRENVSTEFSESRTMTLIIQGEEPPTYSPTLGEAGTLLQTPATLELVRGSDVEFTVTVKNPYQESILENLELEVAGYPEGIEVTPDRISGIEYEEVEEFNVKLSAPTYLEKGSYELTITLTGNVHYPSYPTVVSEITGEPLVVRDISLDMTESRITTLDLHVVSRSAAMTALQQTAEATTSMSERGFSTTRVSRMLERAKNAFGTRDYEEAMRLTDQILNTIGAASDAKPLLEEVGEDIRAAEEERWLKVVEAKNLYNLALIAYEREDYATAMERLKEAQITLSLETERKVNKVKLVLDNLLAFIVGGIILSFSSVQVFKRAKIARVSSKLRDLLAEEGGIIRLMREKQARYYKDKTMAHETYLKAMGEHRDRLSGISAARVGLIAEMSLAVGAGDGLESLGKEDAGLLKLLKEAQADYFKNRTMSKSEYQSIARLLKTERAVVQGRMALLEAEMEKGRMME